MEFDLNKLRRDWIVGTSGREFFAKVQSSADRLTALSEEQRLRGVLITETNPVEFAAGFFGAVMAQTPIILGNPNWGEREWTEFYKLVSPGISFVGASLVTPAEPKSRTTAGVTSDAPTIKPGSILIPTGGTTGGVKLAIHDWSSLVAASAAVQAFLGGGPINSCCLLPLYHVSGLMQLVRTFLSGGRIRFNDTEVAGYCLSLVPTQLQRMFGDAESIQKLNTSRAIFVGGAAMPAAVADQARVHKLPVIPVYGMTETAAMCAAVPAEDFLKDASAGAVPIGDTNFIIEDDGRIRIQSGALFKGYQGHEPIDLSQGYFSGDLGRIDVSGRLHVEGRADRLIISGGEKIDPREVEVAVARLEGVNEVLAVGLPDTEWGQKLVVFYTGSEIPNWKEQLRAQIVNYKLPKEMLWVDRLPLDEKGKFENVGASLVKTAEPKSRTTAVFTSEAPTKIILPVRKTQKLRIGRISIPGVRYFITICTKDRKPSLLDSGVAESVLNTWRLQHCDGDYVFHCGTLMPDHIHFLFTLGNGLSLGQTIIKFKAKTKNAIEAVGLEWQRDFFDHRLRADDAMEGFAKYIFLNPYLKGLLASSNSWPQWHLNQDYAPEFAQHLNTNSAPPVEWLANSLGAQELVEADMVSDLKTQGLHL